MYKGKINIEIEEKNFQADYDYQLKRLKRNKSEFFTAIQVLK